MHSSKFPEAIADIETYFSKIREVHPNMYWHTPKEKIDSFKIALKSVCHDSMSVEELGGGLQQSAHFFNFFVFAIILGYYNLYMLLFFVVGHALYVGWVMIFLKIRRELDFKRFDRAARNQSNIIQIIT